MVIKAALRAYAFIDLFGFSVDVILVNRLISARVEDLYLKKWKAIRGNYRQIIFISGPSRTASRLYRTVFCPDWIIGQSFRGFSPRLTGRTSRRYSTDMDKRGDLLPGAGIRLAAGKETPIP